MRMLESIKVNVKTISTDHIEQFLRCPTEFIQRSLLHRRNGVLTWQKAVKITVHQILSIYFQTPIQQRTAVYILQLIQQHWSKVSVQLFESKIRYYSVLAKITDHLLQELGKDSISIHPLFLYDKYKVDVKELGIHLSVDIDFGEWTGNSYKIKKFMIEDSVDIRNALTHLLTVFSKHAFSQMPDSIEFYCLLTGERHVARIREEQYEESLEFLGFIKGTLEQSMCLRNHPIM
jgi:hypothetical protein